MRRRRSPIFADALDRWREVRDEYELLLDATYLRAEADLNGVLLNARGKRAGISAHSLFMGNTARAHAYASDELIDWWKTHPRVTFAQFEEQSHG